MLEVIASTCTKTAGSLALKNLRVTVLGRRPIIKAMMAAARQAPVPCAVCRDEGPVNDTVQMKAGLPARICLKTHEIFWRFCTKPASVSDYPIVLPCQGRSGGQPNRKIQDAMYNTPARHLLQTSFPSTKL